MPRKPRQFEVGAIHHIVNRGVEKRSIFKKNQDYSRFILALEFFNTKDSFKFWDLFQKTNPNPVTLKKKLAEQRSKPKSPLIDLLGFVLMPNHFHLIVREVMQGGLSLFMQKIGGYNTYFNQQYDRVGPLFQSRYKMVSIKDDKQLATVFAYVHTNPVELVEPGWKEYRVNNPKKAAQYLREYKWSSYNDYVGYPAFPSATQRDFFLNFYGGVDGCRSAVEDWIFFKARETERGPEIIE